ncbi:PAS domain-containing protein [Listeria weihenstephanensis]|uniref:PAS domain-containing protein n=1 Tax=Listeria weihenstephanensis TaxID=1006155 RepID=A0A841Z5H2_9LIST|nr:STAS domain-containing protein [Listeria weihenstephanensis]MBC1499633.1 PAS domain-containing protein [Listeria weihenstephanensis]
MLNKEAELQFNIILKALNMSSVGVIITDGDLPKNPIIYVNAGFERITGYQADEVLGKNCNMLQGKKTDKTATQKISQAVKNRTSVNVFLQNYRKNGEIFFNELTIDPIYDEASGKSYFIGIQRDVTCEEKYKMLLEDSIEEIVKMSTPIVPVQDGVAVLPLVGALSTDRFEEMTRNVAAYLDENHIDYLIMDISALANFTEEVAANLIKFLALTKLTGVSLVLTGVSPKFAMLMVNYDSRLPNIPTYSTVREALKNV